MAVAEPAPQRWAHSWRGSCHGEGGRHILQVWVCLNPDKLCSLGWCVRAEWVQAVQFNLHTAINDSHKLVCLRPAAAGRA
eukprot:6194836-Pleurochrysis_carterae.AAC.1